MTRHRPPGAVALVGDTLRLLAANFGRLFGIAVLPALALSGFAFLAGAGEPVPLDPVTGTAATGGGFGALFLGIFLDLLVGFVVSGVLTLAALDAARGEHRPVTGHLRQTLRHAGPILVLGTMLYLMAGIGLALFVLPGLYILARFLPWLAVIVAEEAGWSGLTRAQELTQGHRLPLAGAFALLAVLGIGAAFLLAPVVALTASAGAAALVGLEAAGTALYYALAACFSAAAYLRLRALESSPGPQASDSGPP